jgi:alpha amylase-like protein
VCAERHTRVGLAVAASRPPRSRTLESANRQRGTPVDSLWFKDAIIYQVYAPACFDTNADGVGDIGGLTEKLDYLEHLGISAIWILGLADPTADALRQDATSEGGDALPAFKTLIGQAHAWQLFSAQAQ